MEQEAAPTLMSLIAHKKRNAHTRQDALSLEKGPRRGKDPSAVSRDTQCCPDVSDECGGCGDGGGNGGGGDYTSRDMRNATRNPDDILNRNTSCDNMFRVNPGSGTDRNGNTSIKDAQNSTTVGDVAKDGSQVRNGNTDCGSLSEEDSDCDDDPYWEERGVSGDSSSALSQDSCVHVGDAHDGGHVNYGFESMLRREDSRGTDKHSSEMSSTNAVNSHHVTFDMGDRDTKEKDGSHISSSELNTNAAKVPKLSAKLFTLPKLIGGKKSKPAEWSNMQNGEAHVNPAFKAQETSLSRDALQKTAAAADDNSGDKSVPKSPTGKKLPSLFSSRTKQRDNTTQNGSAAGPKDNPPEKNTPSPNGPRPQKKFPRRLTFTSSKKRTSSESPKPKSRSAATSKATTPAPTPGVSSPDTAGDKASRAQSSRGEGRDEEEGEGGGCSPCAGCGGSSVAQRVRAYVNDSDTIEGKEIRNTLVVGVAFQLIFTANFAIQNLQSSLHEEESLGVSALGCLYATSIFSSIFAPTIIGVLGTKGSLVLAWISHILYTLAQFYPSWETLVPASILLGSFVGPTWTAQGLYVSACAFSYSKRSQHSPYTILSRFNGLFFTLYETRQVLGNLLSSIVLQDGVGNKSEEVIFKFCGPNDCPYAENVTEIEDPDQMVMGVMLGIYVALQIVALLLTVFLVTPLARSEWSSRAPLRQTLTSWFNTLVRTEMLFLVPFMVFQAMEQGILLSEYTKSYVTCPLGIHMVGFVMATHGGASAVFVFAFSALARHTGRFPLFVLAAVIGLVLLLVLGQWTPGADQAALIFTVPVLWGIGEGIWQTQTNAMIAVTFWDRREPAFANYQTWRAVGMTFVLSVHSLLCVSTKVAIALGFLVVGMVLYTGVEVHLRRKERASQLGKGAGKAATDHTGDKETRATGTAAKREGDEENSTGGNPPTDSSRSRSGLDPGSGLGSGRSGGGGGGGGSRTKRHGVFLKDSPLCVAAPAPRLRASSTVPTDCYKLGMTSSDQEEEKGEKKPGAELKKRGGGLTSSWASANNLTSLGLNSDFPDVMTDRLRDGHVTLDGTFLSREESAFLDRDVMTRYGVLPSGGGTRALTLANGSPRVKVKAASEGQEQWEDREVGEEEGGDWEPFPPRPHSWHDSGFQDAGELRVVWTKDDVFVY